MINHTTHKRKPHTISGIPSKYSTSVTAEESAIADELAVKEAQSNISGGTLAIIALGVLAVVSVGAMAIASKK
jgi:hypothetical protein